MRPGSAPRPRLLPLLLLALLGAGPALAQAPRADDGRRQPLREDPANWWGEVHGWTGSDATRPRGGGPPAGRAPPTPRAEGRATVTTSPTARANVRRAPALDAPVARLMPRNSRLTVFGEAPGGWFQVGEAAPFGWIHESAVRR